MQTVKEKCLQTVGDLCNEYSENDYILQRMEHHIHTQLKTILKNENDAHEKRMVRNNNLIIEQNNFVRVFLSKNMYYYLSTNNTGCFYEYDKKHYNIVKEDDILYKLLHDISHESCIQDWKYKTKISVIKQIKERSLYSCVPESPTIQSVLRMLCPTVFSTRTVAKYFLTIIGDSILKKNRDLLYFVHGKSKNFMGLLEKYAYVALGHAHLAKNFVKYHDSHIYNHCRILSMNDVETYEFSLNQGVDLMCVAIHYSNRFAGADEYILKKADNDLKKYTFMLRNDDISQKDAVFSSKISCIIADFCKNMLDVTIDDDISGQDQSCHAMKWKDMHYLWKSYLANMAIPNIMYSSTLKQQLSQLYTYDEEQDTFLNVTSKYLPKTRNFITFWNTNIVYEESEELELDEICLLFKTTGSYIQEDDVVKIVTHFFPDTVIKDNKYVVGVRCMLWDKKLDIIKAMCNFKTTVDQCDDYTMVSFDELYVYYCDVFKPLYTVSKRYFESTISHYLEEYIVYETFIGITKWISV